MIATTENIEILFDEVLTAEEFKFELYMMYCESVTVTAREFQQVVSNKSVCNYFLEQLQLQEQEYMLLIKNYPNASSGDCNKLFIDCIYKIFSRFSPPLLAKAKKRDEKPQKIKVKGIKIELSILNQN